MASQGTSPSATRQLSFLTLETETLDSAPSLAGQCYLLPKDGPGCWGAWGIASPFSLPHVSPEPVEK